jgi:hypothetical protein
MKAFQICYDGDLTLELATAIRRLHGQPNFDKSWQVELPRTRRSAVLLRYLRRFVGTSGTIIVAELDATRRREFLLIRHSVTPGYDYSGFYQAIGRFGHPVDLPGEATWLVKAESSLDAASIGVLLEQHCPWDSLMVAGVTHDFSVWSSSGGEFVVEESWLLQGRSY